MDQEQYTAISDRSVELVKSGKIEDGIKYYMEQLEEYASDSQLRVIAANAHQLHHKALARLLLALCRDRGVIV